VLRSKRVHLLFKQTVLLTVCNVRADWHPAALVRVGVGCVLDV
jgi:hypothetical protein